MKNWKTLSSREIYRNQWLSLREDKVIRPDGKEGIYSVISGAYPGVFIVPVDSEGNTYLVLQERYTTQNESWEVVAGGSDGEEYEIAARRELLEESGLEAENLTKILECYPLNGSSDHRALIYIATGLTKVTDQLDEIDGIMSVRKVPLIETKQMILRGEITDGLTITALLTALAYLEEAS